MLKPFTLLFGLVFSLIQKIFSTALGIVLFVVFSFLSIGITLYIRYGLSFGFF
ncbi:MAG: hypothetical protein IPH06_05550 [Alphaproteobacteria bacterium]|nr:hypothetical protein [Alphaproteobacteria bacterium]QQS57485.1 MAG: hypothetical protein IPN28_01315 [Alphaproteobacteria bacterium]